MIANYPDRGVDERVIEQHIAMGVVVRVDGGSAACRLDYEDVSDERLGHYSRLAAMGHDFIHVVNFNKSPQEEKTRYDRRVSAGVIARDLQLHNEQYLKRYSQSVEQAQSDEKAKLYVGPNTEKMSPSKYVKMCKDYATPFLSDHRGKFIVNLPFPGSHNITEGQRNRLTQWLEGMLKALKNAGNFRNRIKFSIHAYPGIGIRPDMAQVHTALARHGFSDIPICFTEAGLTQDEVKKLSPEQIVEENERIIDALQEQMRPIDELGFHVLSHRLGYGAIDNDGLTDVGRLMFSYLEDQEPPTCKVEYVGTAWPFGHRYRVTKDGRTRNHSVFRKPSNPQEYFCK